MVYSPGVGFRHFESIVNAIGVSFLHRPIEYVGAYATERKGAALLCDILLNENAQALVGVMDGDGVVIGHVKMLTC